MSEPEDNRDLKDNTEDELEKKRKSPRYRQFETVLRRVVKSSPTPCRQGRLSPMGCKFSVLVLCLPVLVISGQSQPPTPTPPKTVKNENSGGHREQNISKSDNQNAEPLVTAINGLSSEISAQKQQKTIVMPDYPSANPWEVRATVVAALATLAIAFLSFWQWRSMEKQAMYMRNALVETGKAANAAQASAEALVNIERGWILASKAVNGGAENISLFVTGTAVAAPQFKVSCRVIGNTPCRITQYAMRYHAVDSGPPGNRTPDLPPTPVYGDGADCGTNIIAGQIISCDDNFFILKSLESGPINKTQSESLHDGRSFLCVYGKIIYADIAGREQETRFCWILYIYVSKGPGLQSTTIPQFNIGGPAEYNKTT